VKGRPWVDRQAGISNISIELTLGITSLCLRRGFFFARRNAANEPSPHLFGGAGLASVRGDGGVADVLTVAAWDERRSEDNQQHAPRTRSLVSRQLRYCIGYFANSRTM
jgi:hypothetical protein